MTNFILGIIVGLLNAGLILVLVNRYEVKVRKVVKQVQSKTGQKGAVFLAPTEEEEAQQSIIRKNSQRGGSTMVRDLYDEED